MSNLRTLIQAGDIYQHLNVLYDYAVKINAQVILELGTSDGDSTASFIDACEKTGGFLFSVDIDPHPKAVDTYKDSSNWIFIHADDVGGDFAYGDNYFSRFDVDKKPDNLNWHKPIDLLFIDTSHIYEHTLVELEKYVPCVKIGGIVILHDTEVEGEMKAINDYIEKEKNLKWIENRINNHGLGVLEKI